MSGRPDLPRGAGNNAGAPRATAAWADEEEIAGLAYEPGDLWLGSLPCAAEASWPEIERLEARRSRLAGDQRIDPETRAHEIETIEHLLEMLHATALIDIGIRDDRHMVTMAGSRAGKTRTLLARNLLRYPGSVVCFDPKGELAKGTAAHRAREREEGGLGQSVVVLDPYNTTGRGPETCAGWNPLDLIDNEDELAIDQASTIAEAKIVRANAEDEHFDHAARSFIKGLILFVCWGLDGQPTRTLLTVHRLLTQGANLELALDRPGPPQKGDPGPFAYLLHLMSREEAFDGAISGAARMILEMGDRERGSVLAVARRSVEFLERRPMRRVLAASSIDLDRIKTDKRSVTLYICLPVQRMADCNRWVRLVISCLLEHIYAIPEDPATGHPVLMMLEEFSVLGHMPLIEQASGYAAGFGLKLWLVLQDLTQLKRHYEKGWETFLGNAGVVQAFANADVTTLEYLSKRLGECEISRSLRNVTTSTSASSNDPGTQRQAFDLFANRGKASLIANPLAMLVDPASEGITSTTTEAWNTSLERTPLLLPDEIERLFARDAINQIVLRAGKAPMVLSREDGQDGT